jgi:hypothetical protein
VATKILITILLVANLALYGIKLNSESKSTTPVVAASASIIRPEVPKILLLGELPAIDPPPEVIEMQCYSIGPIATGEQAEALQARISESTSEIQIRTSKSQVQRDFWVYLEPAQSRAEALEYGQQLASMGIMDYFVIVYGSKNNAISLGLYDDELNARQRQQDLRALGFNPVVVERFKDVEQHWLDYQVAEGGLPTWDELGQSVPGAMQLEKPCALSVAEAPAEQQPQDS